MAKFSDATGRSWAIKLNAGYLAKVRKDADIPLGKLLAPGEGKELAELIFGWDAERFVRLLWVLCESQAAKANVEPEEFGHLFDRETLDAARGAMADAVVDFTQSPSAAATLRARRPELMAAADLAAERMATANVDAALRSLTSNATAGNSPASSASTPGG